MRKTALIALMTLLTACASPALAGGRDGVRHDLRNAALDYQARLAASNEPAPAAGLGVAPVIIILAPGFDYATHGAVVGVVGGTDLKSRRGHSETGSLTFRAIKPLTPVVSLGFFYQIAYGDYSGGLMVPAHDLPNGFSFDGWSDVHIVSNVVGLTADFNIGSFGKIETAFLAAFETFGGWETMTTPSPVHPLDTRSADSFQDRVGSLTAFWSKDIEAGGVTLTPYLGWRSVNVVLINQTDWNSPDGTVFDDTSSWAHLGAAGLKANWHFGPWSLSGRLGVNHRFSKSDIPGYASRAMASGGVTHLGWQVGWDRTVASWGLGLGYVIPGTCVIDLAYNGQAGEDTSAHTLGLGLIFPF
jgi:hypothetical protein